jgi:hypothetical protein
VAGAGAGCGGGLLKTKGRVVMNGAQFKPAPNAFLRVIFVPMLPDGKTAHDFFVAEVRAADCTFQVSGKDGKGMPPGKYRVALEHDMDKRDLFRGKYDALKSPFVYDVDSGTKEIVIDLEKKPTSPDTGAR